MSPKGEAFLSDWNAPLVVSILNNNIKSLAGSNTFSFLIRRGEFKGGYSAGAVHFLQRGIHSYIYIRHYK
ncbi:hypothetical protein DAPPUDRAFT_304307 [Daphnia pulex]|uniref:Uncharacterized protein n=1 Tax=Daphnia pulex TaxID=6669 RepID=E9GL44_DAPPU|nr:hypothetical protein DAPPUDRAFT_304307 [Daphnia pulex]|eukprot:EFX79791.1 hypothetical protein DAPPUDRAFT_304307 [Daphnia pulex]